MDVVAAVVATVVAVGDWAMLPEHKPASTPLRNVE